MIRPPENEEIVGSFKFDVLQLLIFGLPLFFLWQQGRFRLDIQRPDSLPNTAEFKPYLILFVLITLYTVIVWAEALSP